MKKIQPQTIKKLRIRQGLSQKELAQHLGISDRAVSKWELGYSQPSAHHLIALAKIVGADINDFLSSASPIVKEEEAGMESLVELFKIGRGPSSSHTMGPERACKIFMTQNPNMDAYRVILYGSLAKTGRGHGTDQVIRKTCAPLPCEIVFDCTSTDLPHPNTMDIIGLRNGMEHKRARAISIGGGSISFEGEAFVKRSRIYREQSFHEIAAYCQKHSLRLWEYAMEREDSDFWTYMARAWDTMKRSIHCGLLIRCRLLVENRLTPNSK